VRHDGPGSGPYFATSAAVDTVDRGPDGARPALHINSGEWQSFEVRMRRRRLERLIVRAETALAGGNTEEVREALEEARRLAPGVPQIAALEKALDASPIAAPAIEVLPDPEIIIPADIPQSPAVDEHPSRKGGALAAAALLTLALGATAFWILRNDYEDQDAVASETTTATTPSAGSSASTAKSPSARVSVETVQAASFGRLQSEEKPADPPPVEPLQPAETPASNPAPTATSGTGLPAQAREFEPVPAIFPERPAPMPAVDLPASATIADARTAVPIPAPEPKPSPKPERAVAETSVPPPAEDAAVMGVLNRYASAYSRLDASAAQEVWPAVNRSALSRAFDSLASQRVSLDRCAVDVRGTSALARCAGSATWSPKIGNGGSRTEARNWTFQLAKAGTAWQIVSARVQNQNK